MHARRGLLLRAMCAIHTLVCVPCHGKWPLAGRAKSYGICFILCICLDRSRKILFGTFVNVSCTFLGLAEYYYAIESGKSYII